MSAASDGRRAAPRKRLPVNPSAENLRKQAKRLARRRPELSLQQGQHQLALEYGCRHWAELMHVVETMSRGAKTLSGGKGELEPLPAAANRNDLAEATRILANDSFTQHDLDLALARSVLRFRERHAVAQLLVEHGADPDGQYGGNYGPIVLAVGECLDPDGLQFLLDHGADVTFAPVETKYGPASPMIATLGSYARGRCEAKHRCLKLLLAHGAVVPPSVTEAMLAIHQGDVSRLAARIDEDARIVTRRYGDMPFGNIALAGATLLHQAVEFGELECIDLLVARGADVNAAAQRVEGVGGQTPIFHAVATILDAGIDVLEHLVKRRDATPGFPRIDMTVRATFRRFEELVTPAVTPREYAERAPQDDPDRRPAARELELLDRLGAEG